MTFVFECFEAATHGSLTLEGLVSECKQRGYEQPYWNPKSDLRKSILYYLNSIGPVERL
jgi:hypothetical protein